MMKIPFLVSAPKHLLKYFYAAINSCQYNFLARHIGMMYHVFGVLTINSS